MDPFMRILFLNSYQSVRGGAERLLFDTSIELVSRGHKVSVVVAHDDRRAPNPEFWPAQINRYYVPELMIPLTDRYNYNKQRQTAAYRDTLRYLQDIIDIEAPEIIHVHNFPRIELLNELRISVPIVRTIHSFENLCGNQLKQLPSGSICTHKLGTACQQHCAMPKSFKAARVRAENRLMKQRFSRLIAVSSYIKGVLVANGFPSEKVSVLNNFTRLMPKRLDVAEENLVLYVGRLTPEKGLLELVESISLTQMKPKLLIVGGDQIPGQGSFQSKVVKTASDLGVTIEFQPWCAGDELRRAYQKAKVVAFSSVWPEPFGLVGIESMMQGKPVVAFDCGGVRDWLQHGKTGFLAPHVHLRQFANFLDQLVKDDERRLAMGEDARRHALDKFAPPAHINGLIDIYMEVLDEGSAYRPRWRTEIPDAQCGSGLPV